MALRVAVDFGTSSTCVAVSVGGREPQVVVVDGQPLLSSAVYAGTDGTLFVGQEADRQAALDPSRYEPHPKRRVDEAELLLGDVVVPVPAVFRAVIGRAVDEARRVAGGAEVDQLVLTHPADWGGTRTRVLRESAAGLARRVELVPEPVAAAVFHAASFPGGGGTLAVLDLGGGTMDVSVVRTVPGPSGFEVLATRGDPSFGGADVDQLLLEHVGSMVAVGREDQWRELLEGRDLTDRRRRRVLRHDVRNAKETLSRHTYTDIPLPSPFPDAHVTRDDLERLVAVPLGRAVDLTLSAIADAGLAPGALSAIFLVGGSSRIPLVARLLAERTGVVPTTLDQPETVVARGALRAVAAEREHTGVVPAGGGFGVPRPGQSSNPGPPPRAGYPPTGPQGRFPGPSGGQPSPGFQPGTGPIPVPLPAPAPPVVHKGQRKWWLPVGVGVLVAAAVAVGLVVLTRDDAPPERVIAQYEYRFALPDGWTQTGGDPSLLRTEIKPSGAEGGQDLVLVEEKRLSFDSDADRPRALDKLRADFEAGGESFSDFRDRVSFAGRDVVGYRETLSESTVDWYVLFQGSAQVSVGCRYTQAGQDAVRRACDEVVRSLTVTT